jgi:hypothetical protein
MNTNKKKCTTFYDDAIEYRNLLPESVKFITDLQMFKKEIKCHLKCNIEQKYHIVLIVIILND